MFQLTEKTGIESLVKGSRKSFKAKLVTAKNLMQNKYHKYPQVP